MQRLENDIVDPSTGEVFVQAPLSGKDDVDDAFAAAREAFASWRASTPGERSLLLFRIADVLEFGKVWVNRHLVMAADMPNSGYKHSGHGNDMSALAIEEYTRVKHGMSAVRP